MRITSAMAGRMTLSFTGQRPPTTWNGPFRARKCPFIGSGGRGDKPGAVIPDPAGGKTDVYRWAVAEILTACGIAQLWRDGTWSKGTERMHLMWPKLEHWCLLSLLRNLLPHNLFFLQWHDWTIALCLQPALIKPDIYSLLPGLSTWVGLSHIGSLKRKIGVPRRPVIIGQFFPSWAPHQLRQWWLFQDRNKFIASVHLCLPLELQNRHETIKARKQPLCLSSPSAFASWISFHPAAPQLYICCQFPQFCCRLITKKIRFTVSFNKQSV